MNSILIFFFERFPILKQLDGHKEQIGRWVSFLAGAALLADQYWPDAVAVDQAVLVTATLAGWFTKLIGEEHADIKARRGVERRGVERRYYDRTDAP